MEHAVDATRLEPEGGGGEMLRSLHMKGRRRCCWSPSSRLQAFMLSSAYLGKINKRPLSIFKWSEHQNIMITLPQKNRKNTRWSADISWMCASGSTRRTQWKYTNLSRPRAKHITTSSSQTWRPWGPGRIKNHKLLNWSSRDLSNLTFEIHRPKIHLGFIFYFFQCYFVGKGQGVENALVVLLIAARTTTCRWATCATCPP